MADSDVMIVRPNSSDFSIRAQMILEKSSEFGNIDEKIEVISKELLDSPYIASSLVGGIDVPEQLVVDLSAFDCVTFCESVLALASSQTIQDVVENTKRIRYRGNEVRWLDRNHYFSEWINKNIEKGYLEEIDLDGFSSLSFRTLNVVDKLPSLNANLKYVPISSVATAEVLMRTGDIVAFMSTRENLDVFHCGIYINSSTAGRSVLRHASSRLCGVKDEIFSDFLARNTLPGILIARPCTVA